MNIRNRMGADRPLPPGQFPMPCFPRFGARPLIAPPQPSPTTITVTGSDGTSREYPIDAFTARPPVDRVHDLHCVTTWSAVDQRWGGTPLVDHWDELTDGLAHIDDRFAVVGSADGYRAVFRLDDLLDPTVMLVWQHHGSALDARHGAPLRLVSPAQYGYKSVKHVDRISLHRDQPPSVLGGREHLRARVALEERHAERPARLLRYLYRLTILPTIAAAEWSLRRQ